MQTRTIVHRSSEHRRGAVLHVARLIALAPEHEQFSLLVDLLTEAQRRGVDLSLHWDCLCEALSLEIDDE